MDIIQLISIIIEFVIVIMAVMIATKKKKKYGYAIALTFAIYVIYDLSKLFVFPIDPMILTGIFFIATISMLTAVWKIYQE